MPLRSVAAWLIVLAACTCSFAQDAAADLPPVPKGVEVLARGPVHEAFATLTAEAVPTQRVPRRPPKALEELPPDEKPDGDMIWVSGYWHWDDDRKDFLWVSGIWRTPPPAKRWVAGYWRDDGDGAQWVPGFWAADEQAKSDAPQQVTYLPQPPAPPAVAPPGEAPTAESFWVPGQWTWTGSGFAWRAGYWGRVQPGYVWIAAHYRWTPSGYVFIPGYWDLAVADRGVLYAPIYVDAVVVGPTFVYTPAYAVRETVVIDALFVRPCSCHYYFGDYYGVTYREFGFESCVVYGRRCYDPIFTYACYEHREEPRWASLQVDICLARHEGRAPLPPRTLVQQNVIVQKNVTNVTVVNNNTTVLMPAAQHAKAKGINTVHLDTAAKAQAKEQAQTVQQVSVQRRQAEVAAPGGPPAQPKVAALNVPKPQPVGPKAAAQAPKAAAPPAKLGPPVAAEPGEARPAPKPAASSAGEPKPPAVTKAATPPAPKPPPPAPLRAEEAKPPMPKPAPGPGPQPPSTPPAGPPKPPSPAKPPPKPQPPAKKPPANGRPEPPDR